MGQVLCLIRPSRHVTFREHLIRDHECNRQRDIQDYYGNTALCTIVHRALKKTCPNITKYSVGLHVTSGGRGSDDKVLFTSVFVDDVMFAHNRRDKGNANRGIFNVTHRGRQMNPGGTKS